VGSVTSSRGSTPGLAARFRTLRRLRLTKLGYFDERPRLLPRLGLRTRITLAFGVGAMLLSAMVGVTTWALTQQNLLDEREAAATGQASANAEQIDQLLSPTLADPTGALASLVTQGGASPILRVDDRWFPITPQYGQESLPAELREIVDRGEAARMRYRYRGETHLAVGVPLASADAAYFEVTSLAELESTLDSLSVSLIGASLATTLAGAALGWWVSRRMMKPFSNVGEAAKSLAGGRLGTRLEATEDPDLAPLAESFNEMATALQDRIERDATFASTVSHELRSPLTTLTNSIQVLENNREDLPERAQEALDLLVADVERFQQLVTDLLEITRFDTSSTSLNLMEVRLAELVMQSVGQSTDADIPLDIDAELAGVVVMADKRRLARVIANLLDNAGKYGDGATRVELRRKDGDVQIAVEDGGPGVPEGDRDRIFQRFNRGTSARQRGDVDGVGLGLALVKEHVTIHGGRVWVEDKPDGTQGARFVIALPSEARDDSDVVAMETLDIVEDDA
jgi:two-component system, OmpR family, sensor histidine kinase MtrB